MIKWIEIKVLKFQINLKLTHQKQEERVIMSNCHRNK